MPYSVKQIARFLAAWLACCLGLLTIVHPSAAAYKSPAEQSKSMQTLLAERKELFDSIAALTGIPWFELAAIEQYERTINLAQKRKPAAPLIAVYYSEIDWTGLMNPDREDRLAESIAFWGGKGKDGSGDGVADRANDLDVLYTLAVHLLKFGTGEDDFRIGLWEHYRNSRSVQRIEQFAKLYAAFDSLDLHRHAFPLPLSARYTYRDTWGASRGWGGIRLHEGTDIFANYGVPVRSACYGIVEVMGWNAFGGWRIGIRDLNNVYHYYAHLSRYNKTVMEGSLVNPGQVVGWVGSSGYGKPGTSGKFPPHLHYGVYRDNGQTEWSFDPYPYLRKWEREERLRRKTAGSRSDA